ncbi:MAG: methionyl-tRNA formyltransferase, partial [Ottowia sp.]|nr:methionyl-tRNA formyltransferase [Ottowia sp.]
MKPTIVFAGTPEFARAALERLLDAGYAVPLVLTQPDRPAGRGMKLHASPVKQLAQQRGITVAQPRSLRLDGKYPDEAAAARAALQTAAPDVIVVAAYGLLLPRWTLDLPRLGCLNIHASLLPRWRGAAPIQRAIEAGDAESGVCIMQVAEALDAGDVLLSARTPIAATDTAATLHDKLAEQGAQLIVQALENIESLPRTPQPEEGVTYAHKIEKAEAVIDWQQDAAAIERRIRAFDPFPGAVARLGEAAIKVWKSEIVSMPPAHEAGAGHILQLSDAGVLVACGAGALLCEPGSNAIDVSPHEKKDLARLFQALRIEVNH